MLTYSEALSQLETLMENPGSITLEALSDLVNQVSVIDNIANPGATTYFYSGVFDDGISTSVWAKNFAASEGANIRILNHTDAFKFLESNEFAAAVTGAITNSNVSTTYSEYMYNSTTGQSRAKRRDPGICYLACLFLTVIFRPICVCTNVMFG